MKHNDQQLGSPHVPFKGTTAEIAAIPTPIEGMEAYDTTLHRKVYFNGTIWTLDAATLEGNSASAFAPAAKGVTNGDGHDHFGGDGAQIDHGSLAGLGDDDHPQYLTQTEGDGRYLLQDPMHVHFHDFTVGADTSTIHKGLYQAVPVRDLKDSAGNTWSGAGRNTGTYTFRPGDNSNIWPITATAVAILMGGNWTTSNNNYQMNARRSSGGTNEGQIRALVASLMVTLQVIQAVDANGYFYINISGANMNASVIRIVGYFI